METLLTGPGVLACSPNDEPTASTVTVLPFTTTLLAFQMFVIVVGCDHVHVIFLFAAADDSVNVATKPPVHWLPIENATAEQGTAGG